MGANSWFQYNYLIGLVEFAILRFVETTLLDGTVDYLFYLLTDFVNERQSLFDESI